MSKEELIVYGTSFAMTLLITIALNFFYAVFIVHPTELNQFNFQKRLHLTFTSMQGEENFFTPVGHKKLKVYRKMLATTFVMSFMLFGVGLWLRLVNLGT